MEGKWLPHWECCVQARICSKSYKLYIHDTFARGRATLAHDMSEGAMEGVSWHVHTRCKAVGCLA